MSQSTPQRTPITNMDGCVAAEKGDFNKQLREVFHIDLQSKACMHKEPHPSYFDSVAYPIGWHLSDFV